MYFDTLISTINMYTHMNCTFILAPVYHFTYAYQTNIK